MCVERWRERERGGGGENSWIILVFQHNAKLVDRKGIVDLTVRTKIGWGFEWKWMVDSTCNMKLRIVDVNDKRK